MTTSNADISDLQTPGTSVTPVAAGEPETSSAPSCKNCRSSLPSAASFCPACGQRVREEAMTFRLLASHLVENVFNIRRGFLYTLRTVTLNPGAVARRYIDGERRTYANPLTFFLIIATAAFLAIGFNEDAFLTYIMDATRLSMADAAFESGGAINEIFGFESREEYARAYYGVIQTVFSYFMLIQCLFVAAVLRLFFSEHTMAEYTILSLFVASQGFLAVGILLPTLFSLNASSALLASSSVLLGPGLYAIAGWVFWDRGWKGAFLTGLSAIAGQVLFLMTLTILSGVAGFFFALLRGKGLI